MANLKGGKKPVSQRRQAPVLTEDDLFGNMLKLEPDLLKELEDKGLEGRFVDAKKLYEANGYHPKGWIPYKRPAAIASLQEFKIGSDPDGIVRRGTMILAVKTRENAQKHRDFLKQKAALYSAVNAQKAQEMRQMAKEANLDTVVTEGYDEDET